MKQRNFVCYLLFVVSYWLFLNNSSSSIFNFQNIVTAAETNKTILSNLTSATDPNSNFKKELLREFDVLSRVINEARQKLEQILEVPKDQTGTAEHFSEDTTQMNFDDRMVEAMQPKVQLGLNPASAEAASTKLYSGEVKLDIKSSGDFGQLGRFTERLRRVPNVKLTSLGSCAQGTTMAIIAVAEPIPLTTILKEMPIVEEVIGQDHHVEVALKTT